MGLSEKDTIRVYDIIQQLAMPEDEVLELFEVDAVDFGRVFWDSPEDWSKFKLPNGMEVEIPSAYDVTYTDGKYVAKSSDGMVIAQMPESAIYFNQTCHPLADLFEGKLKDDEFVHLKDYLEKVMWVKLAAPPSHLSFTKENLAYIRKKAKQLYEQTDHAILSGAGASFFEMGQFLYRSDNFFMELLTNPKRVEKFIWLLNPLPLGHYIELGITYYNSSSGYEEFEPATGFVHTRGLNGEKIWNGSFYGILPILENLPFHIGVIGFTGIKILKNYSYSYLGSALWVKIKNTWW